MQDGGAQGEGFAVKQRACPGQCVFLLVVVYHLMNNSVAASLRHVLILPMLLLLLAAPGVSLDYHLLGISEHSTPLLNLTLLLAVLYSQLNATLLPFDFSFGVSRWSHRTTSGVELVKQTAVLGCVTAAVH